MECVAAFAWNHWPDVVEYANYGVKKGFIKINPVNGVDFLPVEKRIKYVPPTEDIDKVIAVAPEDTKAYLWTIRETLGRVSEINRLEWKDVDLQGRYVTLYTRKKKGGHLTPRRIWMTGKLHSVFSELAATRTDNHPWAAIPAMPCSPAIA